MARLHLTSLRNIEDKAMSQSAPHPAKKKLASYDSTGALRAAKGLRWDGQGDPERNLVTTSNIGDGRGTGTKSLFLRYAQYTYGATELKALTSKIGGGSAGETTASVMVSAWTRTGLRRATPKSTSTIVGHFTLIIV